METSNNKTEGGLMKRKGNGAFGKPKWQRENEWNKPTKLSVYKEKKEIGILSKLKNMFKRKDRRLV